VFDTDEVPLALNPPGEPSLIDVSLIDSKYRLDRGVDTGDLLGNPTLDMI